jgi:peroxiredoxin
MMKLLIALVCVLSADAFAPPQFGLLNRFRKKKAQTFTPIAIGAPLPEVDVEIVDDGGESRPTTIAEVLGQGTSILVGMPGAFTPTCTATHLPGFKTSAAHLSKLGVKTIAVLTTNDRFVNDAWAKGLGIIDETKRENNNQNVITMLSDGDGDLIRKLGLAEDMGFGVGIRSKRFALVVQDGVVTHLETDEGMDDCVNSSAENLIKVLTPEEEMVEEDVNPNTILAAAAVAAALSFGTIFGGGGDVGSSTTAARAPTPVKQSATKMAPASKKAAKTSEFSLLNDYMK